MNRTTAYLAVLVFAAAAWGCDPGYTRYHYRDRPQVRDSLALMTKQDVIALTKSRIGDNVIIGMIYNSGSTFHLRTPDVIELADSGVSDTVISAMMKTDEPGGGGDRQRGYNAGYPPYSYWWGVSPWWSPWYFSTYYGYWGGFYRPYYYPRVYAPYYGGVRYRSYGAGGGGGGRAMGRRR